MRSVRAAIVAAVLTLDAAGDGSRWSSLSTIFTTGNGLAFGSLSSTSRWMYAAR